MCSSDLGAAIEGILCGLTAAFGNIGPCGPGNLLAAIALFIHLPGAFVAQCLALRQGDSSLGVIIFVTALLFSIPSYFVIRAVRNRAERNANH